jgi:AraC-like DNA-binding protein
MDRTEQSWSTGQMGSGTALSYWKDVIRENLLDLHIDSADRRNFHGEIAKVALGPLMANFISVSEQSVRRTRQTGHRSQDGVFHLIHVRRGTQLVEHYGENLKLDPGDCLLVDCASGFVFDFPDGIEALVLEMRRDWLQGWLPAPEEAAGRIFGRHADWGGTLASALRNLTPASIGETTLPLSAVAEQIAVLLALAAGPVNATLTTHKRTLLRRVQETLRDRCQQPDLDPTAVAAVLGLSRRYVHLLFASAGTTFSQELYSCRLQRAERLLRDQRYAGVGIAEIAWQCGFNEPSHFTRRFRERFGVAPSRYRVSADA